MFLNIDWRYYEISDIVFFLFVLFFVQIICISFSFFSLHFFYKFEMHLMSRGIIDTDYDPIT